MKLEDEIQQKKFQSEYHKLGINIMVSSSWVSNNHLKILKPFDLSIQQFNILRILRGQQPKPSNVKVLTERMMDKMSNASRLVDKLCKKNYTKRIPSELDGRVVDIVITNEGLGAVNKASEIMEVENSKALSNLTLKEAKQLNELLDKMRG